MQPVVAAPALPSEDAVVATAATLFGNARLPPAADGPSGRPPPVGHRPADRRRSRRALRRDRFGFTGLGPGGRAVGPPGAYRIWLVLVDLRSGRIVARGVALTLPAGVDTSPAVLERDSPSG